MNKVTKNDLLKLKDSKAVPITAHSHEVIVPVVFASKVNKFLEKEGIKLPLTHHQLAEYKKKAAKIKGKYEEDIEEKDEGNSHAKGTHNVKVSNIKGSVYINTQPIKAKRRKGKGRKGRVFTTFKGLIEPPNTSLLKNRIQPPPSLALRPNYNTFAMIRPQGITYSANTPTLQDIQKELQLEYNKQKDAVDKQVEKLEKVNIQKSKNISDLEKELDAERRRNQALIINDLQLPRSKSPDLSLHQQLMEEDPDSHSKALKKQGIEDMQRLLKQSGKTIDTAKRDVIALMEDYARQLGYQMTQRDYKRIQDQNNYQSIGQEYIAWTREIFNQ